MVIVVEIVVEIRGMVGRPDISSSLTDMVSNLNMDRQHLAATYHSIIPLAVGIEVTG